MVLDADSEYRDPASAKYHVMFTLGKSTLLENAIEEVSVTYLTYNTIAHKNT